MWKNKNIWILLTGEFIAGLGLWLGIIGNLEFMQEKVPSDFFKSLILAAGLLAGIIVGPMAGKITDQASKKMVMLVSGFARALSVIFMLIAIHTGSVWWMVVFCVLFQVSAAFYFPALQAAIPLVVDEKNLLQLNGVYMNVSTVSRVLGTALAGGLLEIMSLSMLYILSLIAYLGLFLLTWFLNFDEKEQKVNKGRAVQSSFKDVFPVIKGLPLVFMTLVLTLVPVLFLGGFNLVVINVSELQDSSAIKGMIYTIEGIGFMLGAFMVKRISQKASPYSILFFFAFVIGLAQLLLYFAKIPFLSLLAFLIFGFSVGCFFPTAATIFQTKVQKDFHGRFFSFRNMLDRVSFQIVLLLTGFLLDAVGLPNMCLIFGVLSLVMTGTFYARFKQQQTRIVVEEKVHF